MGPIYYRTLNLLIGSLHRNPRFRSVSIPRLAKGIHTSNSRKRPSKTTTTLSFATSIARARHLSSSTIAQDEVIGQSSKSSTFASSEAVVKNAEAKASFVDPIHRYEYLVEKGDLREDFHQKEIIKHLQRLWEDLKDYDPGPMPSVSQGSTEASFFGKLFYRKEAHHQPTIALNKVPKGLYLYGSVGTGKTMLMDLFHSTLPSQFSSAGKYGSKRIHFHAFMIQVLQRQHAAVARYVANGEGKKDALPEVAHSFASEGRVLCFDEFQVTDIVTAMLLRGLLERLMDFGVVCVMTSNRHPDELYINGIQRESFIPAIQLIKDRFEIVDLDSGTDYRKLPRTPAKAYYHPLNDEVRAELNKLFVSLTSSESESDVVSGRKLSLWGRDLVVPLSSKNVARFTFSDLCNRPLSAADYLELTKTFPVIFVEEIPKMGLGERDQARRFITFIDACYENKTRLFLSSEVPIFRVFSDDRSIESSDDRHLKDIMGDMGLDSDIVGSTALFSGDEELFAFARCVSRLSQMSTKEWIESSGLP